MESWLEFFAAIDLNSAGLNLRKVENVVDDREKVPAGAMDLPDVPQLFGLTRPFKLFFQHLAVADDRVQRSTQLMAHIGKESTLRAVCLLGHFFGLPQAFFRFGEGFGAFLGGLAAFGDTLFEAVIQCTKLELGVVDFSDHRIEAVDQFSDFVGRFLRYSQRVISTGRNLLHRELQFDDRIRDEFSQNRREQECSRRGQHHESQDDDQIVLDPLIEIAIIGFDHDRADSLAIEIDRPLGSDGTV